MQDSRRQCTVEMLAEKLLQLYRENSGRALVVFIEDCDSWSDELLDDIFWQFSKLPICLVAGARRGTATFSDRLSRLSMAAVGPVSRAFKVPPPSVCFESLLQSVMISSEVCRGQFCKRRTTKKSTQSIFRLDWRFTRFVLSRFKHEDVSLDEFTKLWQFALLEHCMHGQFAPLMCKRADVRERLQLVGEETLRQLLQGVEGFLTDENETTVEAAERCLIAIFDHHQCKQLILKAALPMLAGVPDAPVGRRISELYEYSLSERAWRDDLFRIDCCKWFSAWASVEWAAMLNTFREVILHDGAHILHDNEAVKEVLATLDELLLDLNDLDAYSQRYNREALQERHENIANSPGVASGQKRKSEKLTMRDMQYKLRTEIEQNRGKNADLALRQRCAQLVFFRL